MRSDIRGVTTLTIIIFLTFGSLILVATFVSIAVSHSQFAREMRLSKVSYAVAESGLEDVVYRISRGKSYGTGGPISITLNGMSTSVGIDSSQASLQLYTVT